MANPARLLSVLLFATACSGEAPKEAAPAHERSGKARPSLVIATLDTTRADRIGAYGYSAAYTPNIDGLANHGLHFRRAYATVPLTTPSHSSMFTGVYPTRHGVRNNGDAILHDDATTLAELLKGAGYATGASVSAFVTTRVWNLDQGFDVYFDRIEAGANPQNKWNQERSADEVVDDALSWLSEIKSDKPFFLWVHFYDAHHPYRPPAEAQALAPGRPYDGEIAFVDQQIGRLKSAIEARNQRDGVAWIAVGDHGEALTGEHGEYTHGTYVFDPTMRVPFIIEPPVPLAQGITEEAVTVSNVDVMPTALGLLGRPVPADLDGHDLSPMLRGEKVDRGGVYMESYGVTQRFGYHPEIAAVEGPLKLMDTPSPRLFDVDQDPGELTNLVDARPDDVKRLHQIVADVEARAATSSTATAMSPEVMEQLAALGYVNAGGAMSAEKSTIDAKDRLETIQNLEKARTLSVQPGTAEESLALYRKILEAEPQILEARMGLAQVLQRMGKMAEAETVLREAVEREPTSTVMHQNLAANLARQGRFEEAVREMDAILALVPGDEAALQLKVRFLSPLGRDAEALEIAREAHAKNPSSPGLKALLGLALAHTGDLETALPLLAESLEDGVPRPGVNEVLGRVAAGSKKDDLAIPYLQAELDIAPQNPRVRRTLASLYMRNKRWDDAADEYRFIVESGAKDPMIRRAWAQAVFNTGDYELAREVLAPAVLAAEDDPYIILLQANIESKIGDHDKAEQLATRARELYALRSGDKRSPEQQEMENALQGLDVENGAFEALTAP